MGSGKEDSRSDSSQNDLESQKSIANDDEYEEGSSRSQNDVENQNANSSPPETEKEQEPSDPYMVQFEPNDPRNPRCWSKSKKWTVTLMMSSITFISPASSSIVAPAVPHIAEDFQITDKVISQITISIFVLAYAVGPLFLSPLSEIYGRRPILQVSNIFFLIFNLVCGFAQNEAQLVVFRFFAGLGGSAPLAVGGGIIGDIWTPEERGKAISLFSLAPVLGPSIGPLAGGFISQYSSWRWAFYATSIADGVLIVGLFFLLKETYAPSILHGITNKKIKETGDDNYYNQYQGKHYEDTSTFQIIKKNIGRPVRMMCTQPIIQFLTLYMGFLYGLLYIILTTFPTLWTEQYNESTSIGGLNYISISLGYLVGIQVGSRLLDRLYIKLKNRNDQVGKPEFRVPIMWVSSWILPIGLFWYGWSADAKIHWIMPNIGAFILCVGLIMSYNCIQNYVIDAYGLYAASAIAAVATTRSVFGFAFPLWAPYMYDSLGIGWGNSLLGFLGLVIGVPAPWALWFYGARLRAKSDFARSPE